MAERPIEVRRVIFSEVPTLHDSPAQNRRSVSRVTDISHIESTDSAQPNGSASDHPTSTPDATSPVIPRISERLSQPPERYSPGIFFTDACEPTSYEEASASTDSATWHMAMELEIHSIKANKTWESNYRRIDVLFRVSGSIDQPKVQGQISCEGISTRIHCC